MPTSGDLKSGNFFGPAPPPTEFANATPPKISYLFLPPIPPPPISPSNFAGKTWISLSGSSIG